MRYCQLPGRWQNEAKRMEVDLQMKKAAEEGGAHMHITEDSPVVQEAVLAHEYQIIKMQLVIVS